MSLALLLRSGWPAESQNHDGNFGISDHHCVRDMVRERDRDQSDQS